MRRADRLFRIIQNLHSKRTITAYELANRLEVSERTIYRDMQDLSLSGIPITAEAGVGYRLLKGFQLPPLMFNEEEIEALLLGAQMVRAWTDKNLASAANQALQKIEHVIPEKLKPQLERKDMIVPNFPMEGQAGEQLITVRYAIRQQQKINISYTREDGELSNRVIHPLGLFYWGKVWTVVGWCELREAFRNFRLDRMTTCKPNGKSFKIIKGRTLEDYLNTECNK
ncbi:Transcriptional regulator, DeoR family [hydrothermal vent metagenome]|uniref:Transcriptional regulator, DeoR family n=1 Tax=hydrothermal vent metagenome TaxID=652676 RepID=A0A3B1A9V7_9ZZZZ